MKQPDAYLLNGSVIHQRLRPVHHRFRYPVFALRFRLSALESIGKGWLGLWLGVDRWRPLTLKRRDHGPGDGSPLLPWIRQQLAAAGLPCDGEVWLQCFPRLFGYAFNPVSFWYCHNAAGELIAMLAEVNNTFGERHCYLLANQDGSPIRNGSTLLCRKQLHVSPFCQVAGHYRFRLAELPGRMLMRIDYHDDAGELINTSISGPLQALTPPALAKALLRQPLLTFGVIWRIHWQALQLWRKKLPIYRKPLAPSHSLSHGQEPQA
ncbi:DUF1365 domain-containing protein [Aquitalea palustris]|uniref:DUF1365 domain-containing protein n=1 Tax=Aquitalea palustris TaxID=2480983 RepID=UPI001CF01EAD|nr:DUF1365 domain-containing protein [Aquitalea palustris]